MTDLLSPFPLHILPIAAAIFLAGGIVKGALGFGLPLVTMSALPLFLPIEVALALNALVGPFNNFMQLRYGGNIRAVIHRFRGVVIGTAIGAACGAMIVSYVAENVLLLVLGVTILVFTATNLAAPSLQIPPRLEARTGWFVGGIAGVVGALTMGNGPIYVMYLVGLKLERKMMVATLGLFFFVTGSVVAISFLLLGMLTLPMVWLAAGCLVAGQVGMWIGINIAERISAELFRLVVLTALVVLGINLIAQGLAIGS